METGERREERGQLFDDEVADYASYDIATLEQMAESGDIKAMSVLADKYFSIEHGLESLDKLDPLLERAASHGSTNALENLAMVNRNRDAYPADPPQKHANFVESLAWANVVAMRGDIMPNMREIHH